jgi:hypothetical protein
MCFSAPSNFVAGTSLSGIGIGAITRPEGRSELPLSPMRFSSGFAVASPSMVLARPGREFLGRSWQRPQVQPLVIRPGGILLTQRGYTNLIRSHGSRRMHRLSFSMRDGAVWHLTPFQRNPDQSPGIRAR